MKNPWGLQVGLDLSVSSVGSEAMQRGRYRPGRWEAETLSVSSVGSEAMQRGGSPQARDPVPHFQYPRSDRRRCNNAIGAPQVLHDAPLSVSSVGSEAMQRRRTGGPDSGAGAFSILGRIGGDATYVYTHTGWQEIDLSVSSVGSEAMQLGLTAALGQEGTTFQYPRSDRRRCN